MLRFDKRWRRSPPTNGKFINALIPPEAVEDYLSLIRRLSLQGDKKHIFEVFKQTFSAACGEAYYSSTSAGWAESDLQSVMATAAENPPTFIEAYWMGIETLRREGNNGSDWYYVPDADELNEIAVTHKLGYVLEPPDLKLRSGEATVIEVDERPTSLSDEAFDQFERSISRAEELLREGRGREAVQESLWLLESFSLSFRGLDIEGTTIAGKYFNRIADELRKSSNGGTREMAMDWMTKLHGYLSSPTGGGVRHGADLSSSISMNPYEARLFCNLIRSYISYLIEEHAQFEAEPTPTKF